MANSWGPPPDEASTIEIVHAAIALVNEAILPHEMDVWTRRFDRTATGGADYGSYVGFAARGGIDRHCRACATTLVEAVAQLREMNASLATTAPRYMADTPANTSAPPPQEALTIAVAHTAIAIVHTAAAVVAVSHPSSVIPRQAASTVVGT